MTRWIAAAAMIGLAACQPVLGGAESPAPLASCRAERAQFVVGRVPAPALTQRAQRRAGAAVVRVLRPGQIVTMEYRGDRLTLTLGDNGRVARATCG